MNLSAVIRCVLLAGPRTKEDLVAECARHVGAAMAIQLSKRRPNRLGRNAPPKSREERLATGRRNAILKAIRTITVDGQAILLPDGKVALTPKGFRQSGNTMLSHEQAILFRLINRHESHQLRKGALLLAMALGIIGNEEYERIISVPQRHRITSAAFNVNPNGSEE